MRRIEHDRTGPFGWLENFERWIEFVSLVGHVVVRSAVRGCGVFAQENQLFALYENSAMAFSMRWTELPSCFLVHPMFTLFQAYGMKGKGSRVGEGTLAHDPQCRDVDEP